jgi:L-cystine uptake protein TcyP (sodium:dicarboxylate symporter family)
MESQNPEERSSNRKKKKSLMKALKMSVIHVVVFVLSWTPYSTMATW